MTLEDVKELVRSHADGKLAVTNDHGITLAQALISPQRISLIAQYVHGGRVAEEQLTVWLVGREGPEDGYRIVMREDGLQFGLASKGFSADRDLVLVGWYGGLMSAFLSM
jgi:hypothetical protein